MFGYVVVDKPELKFKEYDIYHSYYCGLCKTLKEMYGYKGQISLNYDLTFLALLLSSLYEPETKEELSNCIMHPLKKYYKRFNECIEYAAKMTIVLSYYKCEDDWLDEKRMTRQTYKKILKKSYLKIKEEYPEKIEVIEKSLYQIHEYEASGNYDLDELSNCFGKVMGEICVYKEDEWKNDLYELGFYLGKFIYFLDAYDDIEEDNKKGTFNPFQKEYKKPDFEERSQMILELMISKSATAFECLPIIENVEIIRNILYSGVWTMYEMRKKKRMEDTN
ncbi:MAG: DUF5685 family protein [Coprobacillaceae bacterium]